MMAYSEDHIALAAEYALGTLDADERAQVETMMSVDKDFTAMVEAWEHKLGVLNQMVGSVEPRPEVWDKIRTAVGHSEPQAPIVLPQPPPPPVAPVRRRAARPPSWTTPTSSSCPPSARRWRTIATVDLRDRGGAGCDDRGRALSAGFASGQHSSEAANAGGRGQDAPAAAAPSAQYVAVLQKEGGSPAFILTVDGATRNFTVRKVGASAEPGKSFELWLISDKLPRPRSLGVIGGGDFTSRPVLASYDADMVKAATYAVTVEQAGGSPDGNPHSTPVFTGKLIETVRRRQRRHRAR